MKLESNEYFPFKYMFSLELSDLYEYFMQPETQRKAQVTYSASQKTWGLHYIVSIY